MKYCEGARRAKVSIVFPEKENVLSKRPPVEIEVIAGRGEYVDYTHQMNSPMNRIFEKDIAAVELNDPVNQWCYGTKNSISDGNPPNDLFTTCPTVGRGVIPGAEGLNIDGKRLHSNFDVDPRGVNAYPNNYGSCTYRVYFGGYKFTISDLQGVIYDRSYDKEPKYEVECDDRCPPGYCKCPTKKYPGYCCLSCKDVAARINNLAARIED